MIPIDLANAIFVLCVGVGGILLLMTLLLDDEIGDLLDFLRLRQQVHGAPVVTYLLAFLAMFGVGGLIGTQVLRLSAAPAAALGLVLGLVGVVFARAGIEFLVRRRTTLRGRFELDDLVGHRARVSSSIRAGTDGTVSLAHRESQLELKATSPTDIPAGSLVVVMDVDSARSTLIVTLVSHSAD